MKYAKKISSVAGSSIQVRSLFCGLSGRAALAGPSAGASFITVASNADFVLDVQAKATPGGASGEEAAPVEFDPGAAGIVAAEFAPGVRPVLTMTSRFATRDVAVDLRRPGSAPAEDPAVLRKYTEATELLPTDGIVRKTAADITRGRRGDVDKARAIYDWVVENTYRDGNTRGCGTGDIKFMLENNALGGKCADLNAMFVALARASGIAARDVYGVRVAGSALGYKSLGREGGDMTGAQHCRGEF